MKCIICGKVGTVAKSLCGACYQRAKIKQRMITAPEYTCHTCGKVFKSLRKTIPKYCSSTCILKDPAIRAKRIANQTKDTQIIPCSNCGKLIKRNKTQMKRSKNKVCSKACEIANTKRATALRNSKKAKTPCGNDDCNNIGVYRRGLCRSCFMKWDMNIPKNRHKHVGICPVCNKEFLSWYKDSTHCSNSCYIKSDVFKAAREKFKADCKKLRVDKKCLNCGKVMSLPPNKITTGHIKRRKSGKDYMSLPKSFCSRSCYREYFANRFERYIAQTSHLNKPEHYDSFLSQEYLPCLIDGCNWSGVNLAIHMNICHGVTAKELKALAGFNRNTGVITTKLSKLLGVNRVGNDKIGEQNRNNNARNIGYPMRPEGIEHIKRARLLNG